MGNPRETTDDAGTGDGRDREGEVSGDHRLARLSIPGMDCPSCAGNVESALDRLDGIVACDTRPAAGSATVRYDETALTVEEVVGTIESAGYDVTATSSDGGGIDPRNRNVLAGPRTLWTGVAGVGLALGLLFEFGLRGHNATVATVLESGLHVSDLLFLFAVTVAGVPIVRGGYRSVQARSLDMDLLMTSAVLGALLASLAFGERLYFEAASLAVLFGLAELLEQYSMDRARGSLRELVDLSPDEATVKRGEKTERVPVEEVAVGDVVAVGPGERVPVDGKVIAGESTVDQAPVTGESVPVEKTANDAIYAGTINGTGYLEIEATSEPGEDTLSRIADLVADAESKRTDHEQFVERFAAYYTPAVVGVAVLVAIASPSVLGTTPSRAVVYGLTLLVLACPCAFVLSTPVSVVSGITSAARNGVLIKGGTHLEAMDGIDVVAFDKTGTLTRGELAVTDVLPLGGNTETDVLECARGLEKRSEHPIGEAIVARTGAAGVADPDVEGFESLTGRGVRADLDGTSHFAGTPDLFEELGFDLSHVHPTPDGGVDADRAREFCDRNDCLDLLEETVPRLQSEGKTVALVGTESELEGVIAVADEVRPGARRAIERLRELGVERTVMLTGDNERTARAIADRVGVDDYRAGLLPEEKVAAVEGLAEESDGVAMVGEGVNDAPALAAATVGIAMGAAGTDTAIETADIALMGDDLARLPYLYELSGDATSVIRWNVRTSLAVKAALAAGVPFGLVPIWAAVLVGDAGMTVGVTANAMRLSRVRPATDADADGAGETAGAIADTDAHPSVDVG